MKNKKIFIPIICIGGIATTIGMLYLFYQFLIILNNLCYYLPEVN